jgi:FdhD protein
MHEVAKEVPLSIFINGRHYATAMISPAMEEEFVLGHLFSEGIIQGLEELESLDLEEGVARALVRNPLRAVASRRPIVSGCGGTDSFLKSSRLPEVKSELIVDKREIFAAIIRISASELHRATGGVHSVGLFDKRGEICVSEDIGRHNALDKVIGYGLRHGARFGEAFVASTGRISSEMALKCSVAAIPVIASRGATTSLAIEIGARTGLAIVGFVRGMRMNIYTNGWRIAGVPGSDSI